jgi:hypothetical protein
VISLRFWRWFSRRPDSSTASKTADNSDIAGVSPPPFVAALDRKASRYSLLETIAACSVIAGIVAETWDEFFKLFSQPNAMVARVAIGGFVVAVGIALEVWFASRASSSERKIRDWYALRVAELNLAAEQERRARVAIEAKLTPRRLSLDQQSSITTRLSSLAKVSDTIWQDVSVGPLPLTFEAGMLAEDIVSALTKAEWRVRQNTPTFGLPITAVKGVGILTTSHPSAIAAGIAVAEALEAEGISAGVLDIKRKCCKEIGPQFRDGIGLDGYCSLLSVFVGEHP